MLIASEHPDAEHDPSFPSLRINTGGAAIETKSAYIHCTVDAESGQDDISGAEAKIKGRGNSTWEQPKKPYTLKFGEKTSLFGIGPSKSWVLLADYLDKSMLRNRMSQSVAETLGVEPLSSQHVNLYLNGEYAGVYLLIEKIGLKNDEGFVLEMDSHAASEGTEGVDYFSVNGKDYGIKEPNCTPEQVAGIKKFMEDVWDAIDSGKWQRVTEFLDAESFAATYIVEELFHDADVNLSSFYFHMGRDGRLCSGPIWDFDLCAGNYNTMRSDDPDCMYVAETSGWYSSLLEYGEFLDLVSETLREKEQDIRSAISGTISYALQHDGDFMRNFERWKTLGRNVDMNPPALMALDTWQEHVKLLDIWLEKSLKSLLREYCGTARSRLISCPDGLSDSESVEIIIYDQYIQSFGKTAIAAGKHPVPSRTRQ